MTAKGLLYLEANGGNKQVPPRLFSVDTVDLGMRRGEEYSQCNPAGSMPWQEVHHSASNQNKSFRRWRTPAAKARRVGKGYPIRSRWPCASLASKRNKDMKRWRARVDVRDPTSFTCSSRRWSSDSPVGITVDC